MSRPTEFFVEDEIVYWDVYIVAADGTGLDADSTPVVTYRIGGSNVESTAGITVAKENPPVGTQLGVYRVTHNLGSNVYLVNNSNIRYSEKATISGVDYYNRWSTMIRGVATLADQTDMLAKLNTNPIAIVNPLVTANTLVLINKDNYSATNNRLLTFPVVLDYSSATSVKLIFSTSGTNIKVTGAVVASATSITVDVNIDFSSSLTFASCAGSVCDQVATCDFSLVAKYGTDQETITYGTAYIYDRAVEA